VNEPCPPDADISMEAGFTEDVQEFEFWLMTTEAPAAAGLTEIEMLPRRGDEEVFAVPLKVMFTVVVWAVPDVGCKVTQGALAALTLHGHPGLVKFSVIVPLKAEGGTNRVGLTPARAQVDVCATRGRLVQKLAIAMQPRGPTRRIRVLTNVLPRENECNIDMRTSFTAYVAVRLYHF
jgi:hypothetical protein